MPGQRRRQRQLPRPGPPLALRARVHPLGSRARGYSFLRDQSCGACGRFPPSSSTSRRRTRSPVGAPSRTTGSWRYPSTSCFRPVRRRVCRLDHRVLRRLDHRTMAREPARLRHRGDALGQPCQCLHLPPDRHVPALHPGLNSANRVDRVAPKLVLTSGICQFPRGPLRRAW